MKRTLVTCGWLVTGDDRLGDFRNGELLLAGNRIEAVGRNLGTTADETIDASDKIVMPGLVNAHMHTWQTGLRGIAGDWMSPEYMQNIHGNLGTRYTPEDNYLGNLMGALAQIDGGERGARQRAVCEDAGTLDRGAALGARRRRPRFPHRGSDRHTIARQEGRPRHVARRRSQPLPGSRSGSERRRAGDAGNVDTVIVDGVVRKRDGRLLFPADVMGKRMTELAESAARIMREGGIADRALNRA
jgi:cytosine/adenosine deaminase-related metal-dependent hydrolase